MRTKLCEKYQLEREDICARLISILQLDNNNSFLLCNLDDNIEKQQQILEMKDEIQKYFACSTISSFNPGFECKRPYLNIVRSILRKQDYVFDCGTTFTKIENGVYKTSTKYKVFRNN